MTDRILVHVCLHAWAKVAFLLASLLTGCETRLPATDGRVPHAPSVVRDVQPTVTFDGDKIVVKGHIPADQAAKLRDHIASAGKMIPDRTAETLKKLQREIDGLKVEVCQARVLAENAVAASKRPQDGWKPIVEKPKVKADTRWPVSMVTTTKWGCINCVRAKNESPKFTRIRIAKTHEYDATKTPQFGSLPAWIWWDSKGRMHSCEGWGGEEWLWKQIQAAEAAKP